MFKATIKPAKSLILKLFSASLIAASVFTINPIKASAAEYFYDSPSSDYFYDAPSSDYFYDAPAASSPSYGGSGSYYDATPVYSDYTSYYPDYGNYGGYSDCYSSCGSSYGPLSYGDYTYPAYGTGYVSPYYGSGYGNYGYGYNQPYYGTGYGTGYGAGNGYGSGGSGISYTNNENENTNANSNTNNISNTFNPVNNNDARINVVVNGNSGSQQNTTQYAQASAPAYYAAPQTYYQPSYVAPTTYTAPYVPQSNMTVVRDTNLGNPVSGVFLNEIPATGISFGLKMTLFTLGLVLWSIFAAYMIARKYNGETALSRSSSSNAGMFSNASSSTVADKIAAFKLANMANKGIQ